MLRSWSLTAIKAGCTVIYSSVAVQIACIIKSEQHETSKTMKFPLDTTVGEVVQGFLKKVDPNFNPSQVR